MAREYIGRFKEVKEIYMAKNGLVNDKPSNSKDVVNESDVINGKYGHKCIDPQEVIKLEIMELPPAQPDTDRWNRLMMYLADLQLAYSPNWGTNGHGTGNGDEKLYQFVTGLIEELESWQPQTEGYREESNG